MYLFMFYYVLWNEIRNKAGKAKSRHGTSWHNKSYFAWKKPLLSYIMLSLFAGSQRKFCLRQGTGSSSKQHRSGCTHRPRRTVARSQALAVRSRGASWVLAALERHTWSTTKDLRISSLIALQQDLSEFQYVKQCTGLGGFGRYCPDTCHLNSHKTSFSQ